VCVRYWRSGSKTSGVLFLKKADGKEGIIIAARVDYQCTDGSTSFGDPSGRLHELASALHA